ncbi:MAG TPA: ribosome small subunit-dependent GTPase A [Thermomicrobiales bacterium]|nr:ribosome small subunit-dependent GTPase A [Thermomicrobiales bacterium]
MPELHQMNAGDEIFGVIVRSYGLHYDVSTDAGLLRCTLRGTIKRERRRTDPAAVGDRVRATLSTPQDDPPQGVIEEILPRVRSLSRRARGTADSEQVILANPDQLVAVFAIRDPEPHPRMIDRFLLLAEARGIDAIICANKVDLADLPEVETFFKPFTMAGYPVIPTSALTGYGIDDLREKLNGKITAFAGPSGVGKSSLLNRIIPELEERTGDISSATGKGRHTTTWTTLFQLGPDTFVADTPGMRQLGLWGIDFENLDQLYPEFRPHLEECYYADCRHLDEPDCAVIAAVEAGEVHPDRYDSYRRLLIGDEDE